jgi:hypothetical protein
MAGYRVVLLGLLLVALLLLGARAALSPSFWQQPGALVYLFEPLALLVCYGALVLLFTRSDRNEQRQAIAVGMVVGLLSAFLWLINLSLETFTTVGDSWGILTTAPFLLGGFLLWGIAGLVGAWKTQRFVYGLVAAIWSAMVCALLTVIYGWVLLFVALPRLAEMMVGNPDFARSQWTDATIFAIANSFDAGFSHLLGALLIGGIFGVVGAGVDIWAQRMQRTSLMPAR